MFLQKLKMAAEKKVRIFLFQYQEASNSMQWCETCSRALSNVVCLLGLLFEEE